MYQKKAFSFIYPPFLLCKVVIRLYTVGRCRIRDWRLQFDMTQSDLANESGVDRSNISKYEKGINKPDLKNLKNIADVFGCHIEDLYEWKKITK
jgi:DNA-binding XRE family transcriptional regulator